MQSEPKNKKLLKRKKKQKQKGNAKCETDELMVMICYNIIKKNTNSVTLLSVR